MYDNSTNHSCLPPGALRVGGGVIKGKGGVNAPGAVKDGKQLPPMRDGWFMRGGERVVQKMHEDNGEFKGMEAILVERGRIEKGKVKGVCKAKEGEEKPHENCCCKHVLAAEPDFQSEPTALEDLITKLGHLTKMLPKCHPELNPIEQFWAAVKEYLRRVCGYSFVALKGNIPTALREAVHWTKCSDIFGEHGVSRSSTHLK